MRVGVISIFVDGILLSVHRHARPQFRYHFLREKCKRITKKRVWSTNQCLYCAASPRTSFLIYRIMFWHLGSRCSGSKGFRTRTIMPQCQQTCYVLYTGRLLSNCVLPRGVLLRCARTLAPVWFAGCGFEPAAPLRGRALSIGSSRTKKYRHVPPL